ncbi:caspase family protein [Paraburkholderia dilworthii]|uniref:caspase family protein n=1 Tax=Paraburkholderia dilworthii TaxID=948106 RepID=UPI000410DFA3|nr:caspase family protein [Paraburkholderia dilworthii]
MRRATPFKRPASSKRDIWDKADIVAKFLSTVVIAIIGTLITYQIQRVQIATNQAIANAQLQAARSKAQDDKRTQDSEITVQLLNHLISEKAIQRRLAIVALRQSVPVQVYDPIVQILATTDSDAEVRATAIGQLASGQSPGISATLTAIATDPKRAPQERLQAAQGTAQVTLRTGFEVPTYVFLASSPGEALRDNNPFTPALVKAFGDDRIRDFDGLQRFVTQTVTSTVPTQHVVVSRTGPADNATQASALPGSEDRAVLIAVSKTRNPQFQPLTSPIADAHRLADVLRRREINVLLADNPTKQQVLDLIVRAVNHNSHTALIIYFSGIASTSSIGAGWLASDSTEDPKTWLMYADIKQAVARSEALSTWLFVDAMYADPLVSAPAENKSGDRFATP